MHRIDMSPFHFSKENIKIIEEKYKATHMGFWCTKSPRGNWNETPVDVFHQPNPDVSKGHTNYFGMFRQGQDGTVYITDAASAFSEPITGAIVNGEVIVSRYRHHYLSRGGRFVDGGRDYLRTNIDSNLVNVKVNGNNFIFTAIEKS